MLFEIARWLAPSAGTSGGFIASLVMGAAVTLLTGSIVEWVVHRWIMHRPSRVPVFRLAY